MGAAWTRVRNETVRDCPARHDVTVRHDYLHDDLHSAGTLHAGSYMMAIDVPGKGRPGYTKLASSGSLVVAAIGVVVFGSIVTGVGDWVEGRQLSTVAPWAIPGLALAVLGCLTAIRALLVGKGHLPAAVLALAVALSIVLLFTMNLSLAPPVV